MCIANQKFVEIGNSVNNESWDVLIGIEGLSSQMHKDGSKGGVLDT